VGVIAEAAINGAAGYLFAATGEPDDSSRRHDCPSPSDLS
jgi:hypothetical protein